MPPTSSAPSNDARFVIDSSLDHLYPPFRKQVESFISQARQSGMDVGVFESYRSLLRQAHLLEIGRPLPWAPNSTKAPHVTRAFPGEGLHSYGLAVDVAFNPGKRFAGGWDATHPWAALGLLGQAYGFTWGGTFGIKDLCHFEYNIVHGMDIKLLYKKGGLVLVWGELDRIYGTI